MSSKVRKIQKNMVERDFVYFPDELLWQESKEVTNFDSDGLYSLITKLRLANMREKGLGVAGPQIGHLKRIFYYSIPEIGEGIMINPTITKYSPDFIKMKEGCLSIRGYYWEVFRSKEIEIQWQDQHGNILENNADGILARLIQHEVDHLNGMLLVDYLSDEDYAKFDESFFDLELRANRGPMIIDTRDYDRM